MNLALHILIIVVAALLIYKIGDRFAIASSRVGDALKLPKAVKGATFDAIASSLPEILVALFAVIFFGSFEVGIGTIAGSALFNLLVIPGLSVLVAPVAFHVHRYVISRDALMYIISVFILVVLTVYFDFWGLGIAIFLLAAYWYYVHVIMRHTKEYRGDQASHDIGKTDQPYSIKKEVMIAIGSTLAMGGITYFLTHSTMELASILNVAPVIVAFVLTAAATSIPDTVISVTNARHGDIDDAAANVFGSNTFDILVGLGFPLLIYSIFFGPTPIAFDNLEILFGLLGATIVVLYMLAQKDELSRKQGWFLLFLYGLFVLYVVLFSLGIVAVSVV